MRVGLILLAVSAFKLRDDVAESMSAIDSITNHAILSDPAPSSGTSEFMDAFATVSGPAYAAQAAPAHASCERNMEFAYEKFLETFPQHLLPSFVEKFNENLESYKQSAAFTDESHTCPKAEWTSELKNALAVRHVVPFPSKVAIPAVGMDLVDKAVSMLSTAQGPASAAGPGVSAVSSSAVQQQKGVLETVAAIAATDIPPMIPPPAWNNQPLPCLPMVTGHNCFGAVLYPITVGDFIMADTSDSYLDGVISNFPSLYKQKVGVTDDKTYNTCFSAYMSMQCANTFPTCTTVQAREQNVPFVGRGPMCFLHCVATLIACPGFWMDDIIDQCRDVSVPPVCSLAVYTKSGPAQLKSFDDSNPAPSTCPSYDAEIDA